MSKWFFWFWAFPALLVSFSESLAQSEFPPVKPQKTDARASAPARPGIHAEPVFANRPFAFKSEQVARQSRLSALVARLFSQKRHKLWLYSKPKSKPLIRDIVFAFQSDAFVAVLAARPAPVDFRQDSFPRDMEPTALLEYRFNGQRPQARAILGWLRYAEGGTIDATVNADTRALLPFAKRH